MGPSGSGKTTFLHLLMGLVTPDAGTLTGLEGKRLSPVFQEHRLCGNVSVYRNLRLVEQSPISRELAGQHLAYLGLEDALFQPAKTLSGGMKQRVAVARAVLHGGDILLLDEPFQGLDEKSKRQTQRYLLEMTGGKTLFWITHTPEDIVSLPSEVLSFPFTTKKSLVL